MSKAFSMNRKIMLILAVFSGICISRAGFAAAANPDSKPDWNKRVQEVFVPVSQLPVLLEQLQDRVMLPRNEYEELRRLVEEREAEMAKVDPFPAPQGVALTEAEYRVEVTGDRAMISAVIGIDALREGLQAIPLAFGGVGLMSAGLDGASAPMGMGEDGAVVLFVDGRGRHELVLSMVAPVTTTSARQVLSLRLPKIPASRLMLRVPGDVDLKSGASVIHREFVEAEEHTEFELLPDCEVLTLVMTLNSRLKREDRVVVARSLQLHHISEAMERMRVSFSMEILHRAERSFEFCVPSRFEVTEVESPMLAEWTVREEEQAEILSVRLREDSTGSIPITISAFAVQPALGPWTLPWVEPLDVVGRTGVVGVFSDHRLDLAAVSSSDLIPIDGSAVLPLAMEWMTSADMEFGPEAMGPSVKAFFAPLGGGSLTMDMEPSKARLLVTSNVLMTISDTRLQAEGGFSMIPLEERLFAFDFKVPGGWDLENLRLASGAEVPFESYAVPEGGKRVHARLPEVAEPGLEIRVVFQAASVPRGWVSDWDAQEIDFPTFLVLGSSEERGALAVAVRGDLDVRPVQLEGLTPLDEKEKGQYGLEGVASQLAYRFSTGTFKAGLNIVRIEPRMTARTFNFFTVNRDLLSAHYELLFNIERARADKVTFSLPAETPRNISITGMNGLEIKEFLSSETESRRVWTVTLNQEVLGEARIGVDYEMPLQPGDASAGMNMPCAIAEDVAYQSGYAVVEGDPELDIEILEAPRRVDLGELVDAQYQPGRRLLGVYGFVGNDPKVRIQSELRPLVELPRVIVERVELLTLLAVHGAAQTDATFWIKAKAPFLGIRLPAGAQLWSAFLDGKPAKPQVELNEILLSLPASNEVMLHEIKLVFEAPVDGLGLWGKVGLDAPAFYLRDASGEPYEIPMADVQWQVQVPSGYQVLDADGTLSWDQPYRPKSVALRWVTRSLSGFFFGWQAAQQALPALNVVREKASAERRLGRTLDDVFSGVATDLSVADGESPYAYGLGEPADADANAIIELPQRARSGGMRGMAAAEEEFAPPPTAAPGGPSVSAGVPMEQAEVAKPSTDQPVRAPVAGKLASVSMARGFMMKGKRSLAIQLENMGRAELFSSLGDQPRLQLGLIQEDRFLRLGAGLGLAVFFTGIGMTVMGIRRRWFYLLSVILACWLLPLLTGGGMTYIILNPSLIAALALIPVMLILSLVMRAGRVWMRSVRGARLRREQLAAGLAFACLIAINDPTALFAAGSVTDPLAVEVIDPGPPIQWPEDALVVPYRSIKSGELLETGEVLIPYAQYQQMWKTVHGEGPEADKPPFALAVGSGVWTANLEDGEHFLLRGRIHIRVWAEGIVELPISFSGGILTQADLDGRPARVQGAAGEDPAAMQMDQQQAFVEPVPTRQFKVFLEGRGDHLLELQLRFPVGRQGGWRVIEGQIPAGPVAKLVFTVPDAGTELRLGGDGDVMTRETNLPGETVETVPGPAGALAIRWRPQMAEAEIDSGLTVQSEGLLDIQEDRIDAVWQLDLAFRRGERDAFLLYLPGDYWVASVDGLNVRGWQARHDGERLELNVDLLKPAREQESFSIHIWRQGPGTADEPMELVAPVIQLRDAILQKGRISIRRSPLLDVRAVAVTGASRTEMQSDSLEQLVRIASQESPLGIRPFQAYQFARAPFLIRLSTRPLSGDMTSRMQGIFKVSEMQQSLEARFVLESDLQPVHEVRILVPRALDRIEVDAPAPFHWSTGEDQGEGKVIYLHLVQGRTGSFPVLIRGVMLPPKTDPGERREHLPQMEILGLARQQGDWVLLGDPENELVPEQVTGLEPLLMSQAFSWLAPAQQELAQLAYHFRAPVYSGTFRVERRDADVSCSTITNVRLTERSINETLLLNFTVERSGIRTLSFLLPERMKDCRVEAPLLRQKTVLTGDDVPEGMARVKLEFQDSLMGDLRVFVEYDRLLETGDQSCPLPVVETGRTMQRYAVLENSGRDELQIVRDRGMTRLSRQQNEWAQISPFIGDGTTQAWLAAAASAGPELVYRTKERLAVETAGARIGLAETFLVVDSSGAYRAEQVLHIDNRTEQTLNILLPEGAALWTAQVAGLPVKPAAGSDHIQIPLVKTAEGDLDYTVRLVYAGRIRHIGMIRSVHFPLIRTVNINVEQSHVRLFLPEEFAWFDFNGTMRLVEQEGDLEAEVLAYQNRQVERLVQTLQAENEYAQARASSNISSLRDYNDALQKSLEGLKSNRKLAVEISNSAQLFESAQEQARQLDPQAGGDIANYYRLREAFEDQKLVRGRGQIDEIGLNWEVVSGVEDQLARGEEVDRSGRFNEKWFFDNGLVPEEPIAEDKTREVADKRDLLEVEFESRFKQVDSKASSASGVKKVPGFVALQGEVQTTAGELVQEEQLERSRLSTESRQQSARYAERLNQQMEEGRRLSQMQRKDELGVTSEPQSGVAGADRAITYIRGSGGVAVQIPPAGGMGLGGGGYGAYAENQPASMDEGYEGETQTFSGYAAIQAGSAAVAPTGMTSLAIQIPRRGVEYAFTSPRGESLEITARAFPDEPLNLSIRWLILALIALALSGLRYVWRRRNGTGMA